MSKWNQPMRRFQSVVLVCQQCGKAIRPSMYGGWTHASQLRLHDANWHLARP